MDDPGLGVPDEGDDDVDWTSILVGLCHVMSFITICRTCCCRKAAPDVEPPAAGEVVEVPASALQPKKRLFTSYTLWLFGLVFPLYHIYLDRLVHALCSFWTLNFFGVGWILDGFLMPFYVRSFNSRNCAREAPFDGSRRKLLCVPLAVVCCIVMVLGSLAYLPTMLHYAKVVDLDRIAAQTEVNPYDLLGLSSSATPQEAKAAYRKASLRWHPDRNPECGRECTDKMAEITKAFDLIKKRQAPPPSDRSWQGWCQEIGQDWKNLIEVLSAKEG
eukprot:TRINITY_DN106666_c0_g1_i1.p1 TRINITY_DN106666_c0_g1~~TRINITY_DN106666_c0_g1_i1.p1  ORF type:complete len:286 (-),score=60.21 TRINITY_DN106666_c0_g1_i1:94-915(-)